MPLTVMRARGRLLEIGDDAQERRLAAARRADERDELALLDVEIDVGERDDVAVIGVEGEAQTLGGDDAVTSAPRWPLEIGRRTGGSGPTKLVVVDAGWS